MMRFEQYLARNRELGGLLVGAEIRRISRIDYGDRPRPALCDDIGPLIIELEDTDILVTVDEGMRNIILVAGTAEQPVPALVHRERVALECAETSPNSIDHLQAGTVVRVDGLRRSRERDGEGAMVGLLIATLDGPACIGAYLTELDDSGVAVVAPDFLDKSVEIMPL